MKNLRMVPSVLAAIAVAVAAVFVLPGCGGKTSAPSTAAADAKKAQKWQCPMHPQIVRDGPGDCPICGMKLVPIEEPMADAAAAKAGDGKATAGGRRVLFYRSPMGTNETSPVPRKDSMGMDFVPVYADEAEGASAGPSGFSTVTIDARKRQLLGLKTVVVKRAPFETSIRTTGRVAADERRVHHVHTRYDGFVEHVTADFTGKFVKKGEALATLYSPEVYATQQEYLLALRAARSLGPSGIPSVAQGGRELLDAARQRLILWDIAPSDIAEIERKGEPIRAIPVYAPISGYVTGRTAYHGMKVMPADTLFDILDLSSVWVIADVYEYELPRLSLGEKATMTLSYWPGRSWQGSVTYVYPSVDEKTRTVKVRAEFANPKGELKPEMFANVVIHGKERDALQVPDDAVMESGTRNIVFLSQGEGKLLPREITVGDHGAGFYVVRDGLAEGDVVVRGANFLVDSESRLKAAISAMGAAK
ncbi:MAG: efflux RND transporter periplasmic adaptor subunit [Acidobacteriota bacterium]